MKRESAAIALGRATEAAARLTFSEASSLLQKGDCLFGTIEEEHDSEYVTWRVEPIQQLNEDGRPTIELAVRAYDATEEICIYVYAADSFVKLN